MRKYLYMTADTMSEDLNTFMDMSFNCCNSWNARADIAASKKLDRAKAKFLKKYSKQESEEME